MKPFSGREKITTLFLDIGGVLLTPGWDQRSRKLAARKFGLDSGELEELHHLTFEAYEEGKITLNDYMDRVVFNEERRFTHDQFRRFMFAQSKPFPPMIDLVSRLRAKYRLRTAVVSNEGRELTEYRIRKFRLDKFVDAFISSCFVHVRKPDTEIFRLALGIMHAEPSQVVYVEDTLMFAQVAEALGLRSIRHRSYDSTLAKLATFGLVDDNDDDDVHEEHRERRGERRLPL